MSWTKKDQAKLREYQTAQMTVKEIAVKMQRPQQLIRAELEAMGYKPIEDKPKPESEFLKGKESVKIERKPYARITTAVEKRVCELRESCHTTTQIAITLNIAQQTVSNILKRNGYSTKRGEYHKIKLQDLQDQEETKEDKPMKTASINQDFEQAVDQMIAEAKEKEPAPSANDASSKQDITPVIPVINDSTAKEKSQAPALTGIKMMMELEAMLGEAYGRDAEIVSVSADAEHCDIGFEHEGVRYSLTFGIRQTLPEYREVRK